jgi:hypothetical protein
MRTDATTMARKLAAEMDRLGRSWLPRGVQTPAYGIGVAA